MKKGEEAKTGAELIPEILVQNPKLKTLVTVKRYNAIMDGTGGRVAIGGKSYRVVGTKSATGHITMTLE